MEHYVEGASGNTENLSGATAVPVGSIECPPDEFLFHRFQRRSHADNKLIFAVLDLVNFLGNIVERYPALLSRTTARSIAFRSSRTLPGQSYALSAARDSASRPSTSFPCS